MSSSTEPQESEYTGTGDSDDEMSYTSDEDFDINDELASMFGNGAKFNIIFTSHFHKKI